MDTELATCSCSWEPVGVIDGLPRFRCRECGEFVAVIGDDIETVLAAMPPCGQIRDLGNKLVAEALATRQSSPPSPPPSVAKRARRYAKAIKRWVAAGCPTRSPERIQEIFTTYCQPCKHFRRGWCTVCGCRLRGTKYRRLHRLVRAVKVGRVLGKGRALFNKLAMATSACPRGYWPAEATPPKAGRKKSEKSCKLGLNCRKPNR